MAWYKWLTDEMVDPVWGIQWPQLGEVKTTSDLDNPRLGFHVYSGSRVAANIPWRNTPVDLYQIEVDGEYVTKDGQVYFSEVTPFEKKGTLRRDAAPKISLAWLDLIIDSRFNNKMGLQSELGWNKPQVLHAREILEAQINGDDRPDVMTAARMSGERAVVYAASSIVAKTPDEAWCYCLYLADEAKHPQLGLEFARVVERSMNGDL
jgi:hypothetical protein